MNTFFFVFADSERRKILSHICEGTVTCCVLADKQGWTRDETSKQIKQLKSAGLVRSRQERQWVRLVPSLAGVEEALAWTAELLPSGPFDPRAYPADAVRDVLMSVVSNPGRRSLLAQACRLSGATQVELARACDMPQSLASRGLAKLVAGGLLHVERTGRVARHSVDFAVVRSLWAWLAGCKAKLTRGCSIAERAPLQICAPAVDDVSPVGATPSTREPVRADDQARGATDCTAPPPLTGHITSKVVDHPAEPEVAASDAPCLTPGASFTVALMALQERAQRLEPADVHPGVPWLQRAPRTGPGGPIDPARLAHSSWQG